jgi:Domain of unknown function (DUF4157)
MAMRLSQKRSETTTPHSAPNLAYARPFVVQRQSEEQASPEAGVSLLNNRYQVSATPKYQPGWIARAQAASQPRSLGIQAKLTIGQPNDKYEQEADQVAEKVMSMPDGKVQGAASGASGEDEEGLQAKPMVSKILREVLPEEEEELQMKPVIQREELPEEEEELQMKPIDGTITPLVQRLETENSIQAKCEKCEEEAIQRSAEGSAQAQPDLESRLMASKGGGSPLSADVRSFMEPRFGADFGGVRVHTDNEAVQMNQGLNAQAFAHGHDIYFGAGKSPGRNSLTAHELTHVVQQSSSIETNQPYSAYRQINASIMSQPIIQRQGSDEAAPQTENAASPPVTWSKGPIFGSPIELPSDEAARRVNQAIDVMGAGLTYVRRPPISSEIAATTVDSSPEASVQTSSNVNINLSGNGSSRLEKIHGGTVGSIQVCWDCLSGDASLKGWIWAGIGYEMPIVGWVGGYYFGEKTWWKGNLGNWFGPGSCDDKCDANKDEKTESGFGIAGFPMAIKPKQRASFSKGGMEGGFLLTPHSYCDGDIELIALINLLQYLGPIATVATKAVDGLNAVTKGSPNFELEAGIDISATFHLCRGTSHLLTVNRANFCGGGFVGAGVGLSHSKTENHGAT